MQVLELDDAAFSWRPKMPERKRTEQATVLELLPFSQTWGGIRPWREYCSNSGESVNALFSTGRNEKTAAIISSGSLWCLQAGGLLDC